MLAIHGTSRLRECQLFRRTFNGHRLTSSPHFTVQAPMLGYWLVFPVVCVFLERTRRFYLTFLGHHPARLEALDDGTVVITAEKPEGQKWRARAGQYVSLTQLNFTFHASLI